MLKAIVTDIEGTTSSIEFVHKTLFPYAKAHLRRFLREHAGDAQIQSLIDDVEAVVGWDLSIDEAADTLEQWIAEDRKATPLKTLQGLIWKTGYEAGELKGHVYPDTPEFLRRWHAQGLALYVYSSGSVEAQKLIFGHTEYGDLTPLFSGYFDTRVGGKREAASYKKILKQIGLAGGEVLFLSDVGEELDAAREAGLQTVQLLRDDNAKPFEAHPQARDFSQVPLG
ncbi:MULTISPECIES: acireductone synthase [Hydrocarboniphaga]|jgi:enolase-phosphatase E1|uniref:Enolase-phosphatase E1 n=2 Tax=Gammaproteobacteria TaxID=1236 RepID=I8T4I4_9GAMM|nr:MULTISPECIES: acireductone synthase [Hydrocarboniphaga]EIT68855.1 2,3-diketo-5-methylthio-1-phosphopentane phosphatase [Hydrocarboniphaga effusa AP103]MDZ4077712.1 acireductone synthase [Hydrocarboniphaga sp.]